MDTCNQCERMKESYTNTFTREHRAACNEFKRLTALYADVTWFSFETVCRDWKAPWHTSAPDSRVYLVSRDWITRCQGMYYAGPVQDAPRVPPSIVQTEVRAAREYMELCAARLDDAYTYAPGGAKYNELMEGASCELYEFWRAKQSSDTDIEDGSERTP